MLMNGIGVTDMVKTGFLRLLIKVLVDHAGHLLQLQATEAMVNLYYNQQLNLDLSEQDVLSCSGGGSCDGGYPSTAVNYITNTGIVDENTFPYQADDLACN